MNPSTLEFSESDLGNVVIFQAVHDTEEPSVIQRSLTIVFGLHGTSQVRDVKQERLLHPSGIAVINPMTFYQVSCPPDAGVLCMHIAPSILKLAGWSNVTYLQCYEPDAASNNAQYMELRHRLAVLFRLYFQDTMSADLAEQALGLVSWMCRTFSVPFPEKASYSAEMLEHMQNILRTVQQDWREPLSLSVLSDRHHLSASYISHLFRKCLDVTFTEYLITLRLEHAHADLLETDRSITEIAYENGFKNVSAFIEYFKKQYGNTPSRYRRQYASSDKMPPKSPDLDDRREWIDTLMQYDALSSNNRHAAESAAIKRQITVDVTRPGKPLTHNWRRLVNIGYAQDGLSGIVQDQLRRAVREIGFTDLRFHGIFDDEMHIYHEQEDGSIWFNFTYADILFDFILSIGLTPFVELSYIPSKLCINKRKLFHRDSFIGMYADPLKWEALIQASISHWTKRYGLNRVLTWHFSIFSINYSLIFPYQLSSEEYYEMYQVTYRTIKSIDTRLQFGGVGGFVETLQAPHGVKDLLLYAQQNHIPPDFLTIQCYPHETTLLDKEFMHFSSSQHATPSVLSKDESFTRHSLQVYHNVAKECGLEDRPIFVEEWNSTLWQRDLSADTLYKACWLTKNILENYGEVLGYWLLSDYIEEWELPSGVFHGGYGLFTVNGIPKSGYQAMRLLTHVGDRCLSSGEGWFVSRTDDEIQIYLHHYCHYDSLYRYRYQKLTNPHDAYTVFQNKGNLQIHLELSGLHPGSYRMEARTLTRRNGSAYDKWLEIGAPDSLQLDDSQYIIETAQPEFELQECTTQGTLTIEAELKPHEVRMILMKRMYF